MNRITLAGRLVTASALAALCAMPVVAGEPASQPAATAPAESPATQATAEPAPEEATRPAEATEAEEIIKPRLELHVPSVQKLASEAMRSRSGIFVEYLLALSRELASDSTEGVSLKEVQAVGDALAKWPEVTVDAGVFAPDWEGRSRWAIRLNMSAEDLKQRLEALFKLEAAEELFAAVTISEGPEGDLSIAVPEATIGYIVPAGEKQCQIVSHDDIELPEAIFQGEAGEAGAPLLACRLNLAQTEKDTGATFFSQFKVVTAIDYECRVNEAGDWVDSLAVQWPPISGMALKAILGRVKHTFFVPDESFGAVVFDIGMAPMMIEQSAGLGTQVSVQPSGQIEIMTPETAVGPIVKHTKSEGCAAVLPGTGFLPAPDVVVQYRASDEESFVEDVRKRIESINKQHREREEREPWHEETVRDRTFFWREAQQGYGSFLTPFVMRPVLFLTKETDDEGKERDFVVIGWTSTTPEQLVKRWLDFPRSRDFRYLPQASKTNGQLWVNWRKVYEWVVPYLNVGVGFVSRDALLPSVEEAKDSLVDGWATARVRYEGLTVAHEGPVPMGVLALPSMLAASTAEDRTGGSDLARERVACQHLRVLYHHAKLFHKDQGRWPAEVAELDGYVDFAGNPQLLRLQVSSRKRWSNWFEGLLGVSEETEQKNKDDDADELYGNIDDSLYVIHWGETTWTLGIASGKLEHLDRLYIDQDGQIHRVEKGQAGAPKDTETAQESSDVAT